MAFKKIMLEGGDKPRIAEYEADAAITPGHVIYFMSTGKVAVHAVAGGSVVPLMVALENSLVGKTIADAYTAGDRVQVWFPQRGDIALMRIKNGENIAVADKLESGAAGELRKLVADTSVGTIALDCIIGQALTAADMSGSAGVDVPLCLVRIK